jgi:hypothetical protein
MFFDTHYAVGFERRRHRPSQHLGEKGRRVWPWAGEAGANVRPAALMVRLWARDDLDGVIVPPYDSTCASVASVSGSQKVISMARYSVIAVASTVRACSAWPVLVYSVPRPR